MSGAVHHDVADIAALLPGEVGSEHIELVGRPVAGSAFDVDGVLATTAVHAVAAADAAGLARGVPLIDRRIDLAHVLSFCTTHVEINGEPVPAWADLSGVYPTADGRHLQVHCNFPHHARGVVGRLGCAPDRDAVAAAISRCDAFELEADLIGDGMIGAVVRTLDEWEAHPHAAATRESSARLGGTDR